RAWRTRESLPGCACRRGRSSRESRPPGPGSRSARGNIRIFPAASMPMPSAVNEPALEELSAYLDHELGSEAHARVAAHIAGCQDCQARLDGLRQTTYAVRALPMETPPRAFTIPAQRELSSRRWVPAAWLGGAAAAGLVIVIGVTQLGHLPSMAPSGAGTSMNYSDGSRTQKSAEHGAAAPVAAPAASALDRQFDAQSSSASANRSTVGDPS